MSTSFQQGQSITPSDTEDLPFVAEAISSVSGGVVYVDYDAGGSQVPLFLTAGAPYVSRITKVWATHLLEHEGHRRATGLTAYEKVTDAGIDAAVRAAMSDERAQRIAQDQALSTADSAEASIRADADTALQSALNDLTSVVNAALDSTDSEYDQISEVAARIRQLIASVDGLTIGSVQGLQPALDALGNANTAEASARTAADAALQTAISDLTTVVNTALDSTDSEYDQISEVAARIRQLIASVDGLTIGSVQGLDAVLESLSQADTEETAARELAEVEAAKQLQVVATGKTLNIWPNPTAKGRASVEPFLLPQHAELMPDGAVRHTAVSSGGAVLDLLQPNQEYGMDLKIRIPPGMAKNPLWYWNWVDHDGLGVSHHHVHYWPGTLTTLTAPLSPGDTSVEVSDTTSWEAKPQSYYNWVGLGNYTDTSGNQYSPEGYTRWVTTDGFTEVADGVITLGVPWGIANPKDPNGVWPIGTPIRQHFSGSSYFYFLFDYTVFDFNTPGEYFGSYSLSPGPYAHTEVRTTGRSRQLEDFSKIHFGQITYVDNMPDAVPEILDFAIYPVSEENAVHKALSELADTAAVIDGWTAEAQADLNRMQYQTGLMACRQYAYNKAGTDERVFDAVYAAASAHVHADHRHLVGMAEWAAMANGYYIRGRHTDYKTLRAIQGAYLAREETAPPAIPANVLAKPTGLTIDGSLDTVADTQAKWFQELQQGLHNDSIEPQLAFLEIWLEEVGEEGRSDAADSSRHADVSGDLLESFEENTRVSAGGAKLAGENLGIYPAGASPYTGEDGVQRHRRFAVNFRINTVPIGTAEPISIALAVPVIHIGNSASHEHQLDRQLTPAEWDGLRDLRIASVTLTSTDVGHTHSYTVTWNNSTKSLEGVDTFASHQHAVHISQGFSGGAPFDRDKARDGIIDDTNRFRLVLDPISLSRSNGSRDTLASSRLARFEYVDIEDAMRQCWGMEGEGAVLSESYAEGTRTISFNDIDDPSAAGEPSLNAAKYNRAAIMLRSDASGRAVMHRGFNDPMLFVAKTTHEKVVGGFSYAIPLEIHMRSPIEIWNPAGVTVDPANYADLTAAGAGTQASPHTNVFGRGGWNFTPAAIWGGDAAGSDPADTPRSLWMTGADGNAYEMTASGLWFFTPGGQRQRIPIYKTAFEGSHAETHQRAVNRSLKGLLSALVGTAGITQADIDALPIDDAL